MFFNRRRDGRIFALQQRIAAAHQALRLGEFADDFRHQIRFGECRRARSLCRIRTDQLRQMLRQRHDALHACALRAELFVEDDIHRLQLFQSLIERFGCLIRIIRQRLAVRLPEIKRIRQTRADHAAIASRNRFAIVGSDNVGDEQEFIGQRAIFRIALFQHETFLVGTDRRADDFGGNVEESLVKFAHQHDRPFNKSRHFIEQAFIFDQFETLRESEIFRIRQNDLFAASRIENDFGFVQRAHIIIEAAHFDRAGCQETMAIGDVT